jgi:NTP pyrophosphatase (non-canonical NTP hydrolase)
MKQSQKTFAEIDQKIVKYLEDRNWAPKKEKIRSTVISIALEANELLEHYQWDDEASTDKSELADELADIMIYCFQYASTMEIDIANAIEVKLKKQEKKYPAEVFKGLDSDSKQSSDLWVQAKIKYNQKKKSL